MKQEGPWALDSLPGEDANHISPTPKFILGISQIITKAYRFTEV